MLGFLSVLAVFMSVTIVSYGILPREEIAALRQPSMAGVLEAVVGGWGAVFIGVASKDETAKKARELDRTLRQAGWPHLASEKKVGHVVSDDHLVQALRYLRAKASGAATPASTAAASPPAKPKPSAPAKAPKKRSANARRAK